MKVKIKKLNENAVMPKKAHASDAGFDLVATSRDVDEHGNVVYGTGLAFEIPEGYAGFIFPRSSISYKNLALSNAVGIIDSHYRGEVMAKFRVTSIAEPVFSKNLPNYIIISTRSLARTYEVGERIAQIIIMPYPEIEFEETDELSTTDRGTGGYGSTGR